MIGFFLAAIATCVGTTLSLANSRGLSWVGGSDHERYNRPDHHPACPPARRGRLVLPRALAADGTP